jgi:hypothetical protein
MTERNVIHCAFPTGATRMAIADFVSGRGWDLDTVQPGSLLHVGDTLIIGWLGDDHILLQFRRNGGTYLEGRAQYAELQGEGIVDGSGNGFPVRLTFTGQGVLQVEFTPAGGGPINNGGGTSSGPGGN